QHPPRQPMPTVASNQSSRCPCSGPYHPTGGYRSSQLTRGHLPSTVGPSRNRFHRLDDIVGYLLGNAALALINRVLVEYFTGVGFYALNKVRVVPHAAVG